MIAEKNEKFLKLPTIKKWKNIFKKIAESIEKMKNNKICDDRNDSAAIEKIIIIL